MPGVKKKVTRSTTYRKIGKSCPPGSRDSGRTPDPRYRGGAKKKCTRKK